MEKEKKVSVSKEVRRATAEEVFKRITEVIVNTFVATYEKENNRLFVRLPNGQRFRVEVEEV